MSRNSTLEIIWQESIETFRTQLKLSTQIITFLIISDVTLVGYAVSNKNSFLLLSGVVFPVLLILFIKRLRRTVVPIVYTAIKIEEQLGIDENLRLSSNYSKYAVGISGSNYDMLKKFDSIEELKSSKLKLADNVSGMMSDFSIIGILLIIIAHLIIPGIFYLYNDWSLF